jgi:hypothetical protein
MMLPDDLANRAEFLRSVKSDRGARRSFRRGDNRKKAGLAAADDDVIGGESPIPSSNQWFGPT